MGPARLVYPNGNLAAKGNVDGVEVDTLIFWTGNDRFEYWLDDRRKLACWEEWFAFQSNDFIPRQIHGKPLMTEEEWRALASEMQTAVQDRKRDRLE